MSAYGGRWWWTYLAGDPTNSRVQKAAPGAHQGILPPPRTWKHVVRTVIAMDPVASPVRENGTRFDVRQAASYAIVQGENGTRAQRLAAESSTVRHI